MIIIKKLFDLDLHGNRVFGLDLLRFFAIAFVMMAHGRFFLEPFFSASTEQLNVCGFAGVELFFVLSGFLIGGIFIKICEKERKLTLPIILNFWKRRWYRTIPNYYLILILATLVALTKEKSLFTNYNYYLYYIFSQNLFTKIKMNFFDESWSLAIEEWFYLTIPILFGIIFRIARVASAKVNFKYVILSGILLLIVTGLLVRINYVLHTERQFDHIRGTVSLRLDSIIWGVLFAWINFYHQSFFVKARYFFLAVGIVVIIPCMINYQTANIGIANFFSKTYFFTITDFAFACFIPAANQLRKIRSKFISNTVTTVSLVSYSMYLTHLTFALNIILLLRKIKVPIIKDFETNKFCGIIGFILYWGLTLIISILLYKYYEKPMTDLRDKGVKHV